MAKRPENPRAHDGLAEAFTELGRVDEALTHRREAVRLEPNESRYHYNLAMTLSAAQPARRGGSALSDVVAAGPERTADAQQPRHPVRADGRR